MTGKNRELLRRGAACFCIILFGLLLGLVLTENTAGFDDPVRTFFYSLRNEGLTRILIVITNFADKYTIIGLCLALLIIPGTRLRFGIPLSAGALGTVILNSIIKHLVMRERPEVLHLVTEHGFSFPSGHSISSMFFYGMGLWLLWHYLDPGTGTTVPRPEAADLPKLLSPTPIRYTKKTAAVLTVFLLIPLIIVGLSRIYLGVHFPTDVLAGWALAGAWIFIEAEVILAVERRLSTRSPGDLEPPSDSSASLPSSH